MGQVIKLHLVEILGMLEYLPDRAPCSHVYIMPSEAYPHPIANSESHQYRPFPLRAASDTSSRAERVPGNAVPMGGGGGFACQGGVVSGNP
jgi:hypothetical protein